MDSVSWLAAILVAGVVGALVWWLTASTYSGRRRTRAAVIMAQRYPPTARSVGRHALVENDDTEPPSGRHHHGSRTATVSVAVLLADALHEGRALWLAWPHEDNDFPTAPLPVESDQQMEEQ